MLLVVVVRAEPLLRALVLAVLAQVKQTVLAVLLYLGKDMLGARLDPPHMQVQEAVVQGPLVAMVVEQAMVVLVAVELARHFQECR